MKFHKPHRLKGFDYSSACSYLLTITTKGRAPILSRVVYRGMYEPSTVELLPCGMVTEKYLLRIPDVYPNVTLDNYVIMPDHVHILLTIERNDAENKGTDKIIRATKAMITREIGRSIWQTDFYDVIADTEELFLRCDRYIDENPAAWIERHGEPTAPK